jgi:hypothetical protein
MKISIDTHDTGEIVIDSHSHHKCHKKNFEENGPCIIFFREEQYFNRDNASKERYN